MINYNVLDKTQRYTRQFTHLHIITKRYNIIQTSDINKVYYYILTWIHYGTYTTTLVHYKLLLLY